MNHLPFQPGPPGRDTYMDTLRVVSLAWVVLFHWLGILPQLQSGAYTDRMITAALPGLWPLTWLIDVVPLFMFVGGFANARSYEASRKRGEFVWRFLTRRYQRILVPTLVLLAACWALAFVGGRMGGLGPSPHLLSVRNTAPFGQLWFVGAYLIEITLVPVTLPAHRRFGVRALVVIIAAAAATDLTCWTLGSTIPLVLDFALVWMVPHQLGYFYADGKLQAVSARTLVIVALVALGALALLTSLPAYPRNLLERHWQIFGIDAFTFPLVVQSLWIVAAALLARPALVRLLERRPRLSHRVRQTNEVIVLLFLWHTAAFLAAVLALRSVPGVVSSSPTTAWWVVRPLVVTASACLFAVLLGVDAVGRRGGQILLAWSGHGPSRPRPVEFDRGRRHRHPGSRARRASMGRVSLMPRARVVRPSAV